MDQNIQEQPSIQEPKSRKVSAGRVIFYVTSVLLFLAIIGGFSVYFVVTTYNHNVAAQNLQSENDQKERQRAMKMADEMYVDSLVGEWRATDSNTYTIVMSRTELKLPDETPLLYSVDGEAGEIRIDINRSGSTDVGYDSQMSALSEDKMTLRFNGDDPDNPGTRKVFEYRRVSTNPNALPHQ